MSQKPDTMRLQSTRLEYEFSDESGYEFRVIATKDRDGWHALVSLSAGGCTTPEAAISSVATSAKEFLRLAKSSGVGPS